MIKFESYKTVTHSFEHKPNHIKQVGNCATVQYIR